MQAWEEMTEDETSPMFRIRVNEESANDFLEIRKTKMTEMKKADKSGLKFCSRDVTCNVNFPTIRHTILDEKPFFICAVVCTLDLTSCTRKSPTDEKEVTLVPDLWCILTDQRALLHTKDKTNFDRLRFLDPVCFSPTVEYFAEMAKSGGPVVQKVQITYYMESEWLKNMFEYLLPVLFCNIATTFKYCMILASCVCSSVSRHEITRSTNLSSTCSSCCCV